MMPPTLLHMLLTLVVADSEHLLGKAKMPALRALLVAYAKEGVNPKVGGLKPELVKRVAAAVMEAGKEGFVRPPIFAPVDTVEDVQAAPETEGSGEAAGEDEE